MTGNDKGLEMERKKKRKQDIVVVRGDGRSCRGTREGNHDRDFEEKPEWAEPSANDTERSEGI